jgi:hypothetical protein
VPPLLSPPHTGAHEPGHDCLLSSGLWEMTQFNMSSVNRFCVVAKVTTEHAQRQPAEVPSAEC